MKQSTQSIRHRNNNAKQRGKRWKCGTILLYGTILSLGLFLLVLHHSIGHIILLQQENKQTEKLLPFLGKTGAEMKKKKTQKVVGNTSEGEKDKKNRYHLVFSTSCKNIDWQSYLFFYLAHAHKQAGEITSIVSGCASEEEEEEIRQLHQERFANAMNPNFHIHITPDFSIRTKYQQTKYWNKPFGLKHWMEHRFGFKYDLEKGDVAETTEYDDDIVILIDPDMLMLKPFHNDFSSHPITLWTSYFQKHPEDLYYEVKQGQVIAQAYAFGGKWLNSLAGVSNGVANVLNTTDSPVYTITKEQVNSVYGGGPPYMATARDFYKISHHWTDFLPRYYAELPNMMNEMYSYSLAVAHLGLKHQLAKGFMISDTGLIHQEGWDFLAAPFGNDHDKMLREACNMSVYDQKSLPQVLHFCQRYGAGEFFLTKYKVPRRTFTCEFPMYVEPPIDVATAEYIHMGDFSIKTFNVKSSSDNIKRAANAFMVCSLYKALNEAATFYKDNHCNASNTNYEKSWQYFKVYDKDPHGPGMKGLSKSKP